MKIRFTKTGFQVVLIVYSLFLIGIYELYPQPLFNNSYSFVLNDRNDEFMGARVAEDGQWRFPLIDSVPYKFENCILQFEDKRFYFHPGIDPAALVRALYQNITRGKIVSGASTITMQTVRLSYGNKARTIKQKFIEVLISLSVELHLSKSEILKLYSSHAPFGGNVVGLEAASWRYFSKPAYKLSWAESATLAVLPNNPSVILPGKNESILRKKRDRLLKALLNRNRIDSSTYKLALIEEIPQKPKVLVDIAPHFLEWRRSLSDNSPYHSSLSSALQTKVQYALNDHVLNLKENGIHHAAAIVINIRSGQLEAYCGNNTKSESEHPGNDVDIIQAPRSPGSALKPLLYSLAMSEGILYPTTLLPDVPTYIHDFAPKNYNEQFEGAVHAFQALSRSLNVPSVHLLRKYGHTKFLHDLKELGFSNLNKGANHYGLTMILGGGEVSLWNLAAAYLKYAETLNEFNNSGLYGDIDSIRIYTERKDSISHYYYNEAQFIDAGSIWLTFKAMELVNRPESQKYWQRFSSSRRVAWKTGTSFGNRDAWAVAATPDYIVAIWCGNANGEGRPGLTGVDAAAPLLFRVINLLPNKPYFKEPKEALELMALCYQSGYPLSENCVDTIMVQVNKSQTKLEQCPYHHKLHLDSTLRYRVNSSCYPVDQIRHQKQFILSPLVAKYYRLKHPDYKEFPPLMNTCLTGEEKNIMNWVYPQEDNALFLPVDLDGQKQKAVFEVSHARKDARLFWVIEEQFIKITEGDHQIAIDFPPGNYTISVSDERGNTIKRRFKILST